MCALVWGPGAPGPPRTAHQRTLSRCYETVGMTHMRHGDLVDVELTARDTEFLGDLYQHITGSARKGRALVQTPGFVREFILDHTLTPALMTFGFDDVDVVDPACGTGHFLVDAMMRIFACLRVSEPAMSPTAAADHALAAVAGVDLDPVCVALTRIRLAALWLDLAGRPDPSDAKNLVINVACADSLLHGPDSDGQPPGPDHHCVGSPDCAAATAILTPGRYAVVVGNPPYIVAPPALRNVYAARYPRSCHGKYSMSVPFTELLFGLGRRGSPSAEFAFSESSSAIHGRLLED